MNQQYGEEASYNSEPLASILMFQRDDTTLLVSQKRCFHLLHNLDLRGLEEFPTVGSGSKLNSFVSMHQLCPVQIDRHIPAMKTVRYVRKMFGLSSYGANNFLFIVPLCLRNVSETLVTDIFMMYLTEMRFTTVWQIG